MNSSACSAFLHIRPTIRHQEWVSELHSQGSFKLPAVQDYCHEHTRRAEMPTVPTLWLHLAFSLCNHCYSITITLLLVKLLVEQTANTVSNALQWPLFVRGSLDTLSHTPRYCCIIFRRRRGFVGHEKISFLGKGSCALRVVA